MIAAPREDGEKEPPANIGCEQAAFDPWALAEQMGRDEEFVHLDPPSLARPFADAAYAETMWKQEERARLRLGLRARRESYSPLSQFLFALDCCRARAAGPILGPSVLLMSIACLEHGMLAPEWLIDGVTLRRDLVLDGKKSEWNAADVFGCYHKGGKNLLTHRTEKKLVPSWYMFALTLIFGDPKLKNDTVHEEIAKTDEGKRSAETIEKVYLKPYIDSHGGVLPTLDEFRRRVRNLNKKSIPDLTVDHVLDDFFWHWYQSPR